MPDENQLDPPSESESWPPFLRRGFVLATSIVAVLGVVSAILNGTINVTDNFQKLKKAVFGPGSENVPNSEGSTYQPAHKVQKQVGPVGTNAESVSAELKGVTADPDGDVSQRSPTAPTGGFSWIYSHLANKKWLNKDGIMLFFDNFGDLQDSSRGMATIRQEIRYGGNIAISYPNGDECFYHVYLYYGKRIQMQKVGPSRTICPSGVFEWVE